MYLQANSIEKYYGDKEARVQVLKGISCEIAQGEIWVLLGPSGSGKSTLLNLIGGIEHIDKGELLVGGKDLAKMCIRDSAETWIPENHPAARNAHADIRRIQPAPPSSEDSRREMCIRDRCKEAEGIQPDGNTMRQKDFLYIASIWQKTYCSPDMVFPISAPSDRSFRKRRAPETGSLRFPVLFLHHGSYQ